MGRIKATAQTTEGKRRSARLSGDKAPSIPPSPPRRQRRATSFSLESTPSVTSIESNQSSSHVYSAEDAVKDSLDDSRSKLSADFASPSSSTPKRLNTATPELRRSPRLSGSPTPAPVIPASSPVPSPSSSPPLGQVASQRKPIRRLPPASPSPKFYRFEPTPQPKRTVTSNPKRAAVFLADSELTHNDDSTTSDSEAEQTSVSSDGHICISPGLEATIDTSCNNGQDAKRSQTPTVYKTTSDDEKPLCTEPEHPNGLLPQLPKSTTPSETESTRSAPSKPAHSRSGSPKQKRRGTPSPSPRKKRTYSPAEKAEKAPLQGVKRRRRIILARAAQQMIKMVGAAGVAFAVCHLLRRKAVTASDLAVARAAALAKWESLREGFSALELAAPSWMQ